MQKAPWKLARQTDQASQAELEHHALHRRRSLRIATALLDPGAAAIRAEDLGAARHDRTRIDDVRFETLEWGTLQPGQKIGEIAGVFPRIEVKEAVAKMRELEETGHRRTERAARQEAGGRGRQPRRERPRSPIDDFVKVDLRVGLVQFAERVKGSDKLMHMKVDIGEPEPRTIVAGIAEAYTPEQLLERKVVIVANLQPRKLKGIESNGMIVAASVEGGKPVLAGFLEDIPVGARLK